MEAVGTCGGTELTADVGQPTGGGPVSEPPEGAGCSGGALEDGAGTGIPGDPE